MKYWTGIGSRSISEDEKATLEGIGQRMAELGYTLLSGGAEGSDKACWEGVCRIDPGLAAIQLPWEGFNKDHYPKNSLWSYKWVITPEQIKRAGDALTDTGIMPYFWSMKQSLQRLHGRNYLQVIQPEGISKVCIYCTDEDEEGQIRGGTRSAVMLARQFGVPTYNIRIYAQKLELLKKLKLI